MWVCVGLGNGERLKRNGVGREKADGGTFEAGFISSLACCVRDIAWTASSGLLHGVAVGCWQMAVEGGGTAKVTQSRCITGTMRRLH